MQDIEWFFSKQPIDYESAIAAMDDRVGLIKAGKAREMIWCLEHISVYTAGTGLAIVADDKSKMPSLPYSSGVAIVPSGRGGQITWHGAGQRVCYVMIDLMKRRIDAHQFVKGLLLWCQSAIALLGVKSFLLKDKDKIGLWVAGQGKDRLADKICAIGVRLSPHRIAGSAKLISSHGIAINLNPDLQVFDNIEPCGIKDRRYGVTSLFAAGYQITMQQLDNALKTTWQDRW
ncbi:MAG: lipoyl(octanoyl) transferase LipB [Alphaproteobacteria bacterium]